MYSLNVCKPQDLFRAILAVILFIFLSNAFVVLVKESNSGGKLLYQNSPLAQRSQSDLRPRRQSDLGPRNQSDLGPKRQIGLGPRRQSDLRPRNQPDLGSGRQSDLGPKRQIGLGPRRQSDLGPRRQSDVLISAYMRGGSKLLGNILGGKEGMFYFYEPLWKLTPYGVLMGKNECSVVTDKCSNSTLSVIAKQILAEIYNCNFTTFGKYIYPWLHINYGGLAWNSILNCYASKPNCYRKLEEKCRNSHARVAKIIRTSLDNFIHLLESHPRLKIVHMYRDPRAIIYSRVTSMPHIFKNITASSSSLCKKILDDSNKIKLIEQKFPHRILELYYEDLVENFDKTVKKLYNFFNFEYSSEDDKRLLPMKCNKRLNKRTLGENIWNTIRADSLQASVKWRRAITMDAVKQIDVLCSKAYLATGYKKMNSLVELRDVKIKLLQT